MQLFVITLIVFLVFFFAMGIGFIVQKKELKGSCGGTANLMGDEKCQFCGGETSKCKNKP